METETWKDIPGYERVYQASNFGKIKRLANTPKCKKERILKPGKRDKYGHLTVNLWKNGYGKTYQVHRLVLETFVGPRPPGMECRHLDGNPANNRLDNLKWGTKSENQLDRRKHGTKSCPNPIWINNRGEKSGKAKLNERQVRIIKWLFKYSNMTNSEIAKIFDVHKDTIRHIRNNRTWLHVKGF